MIGHLVHTETMGYLFRTHLVLVKYTFFVSNIVKIKKKYVLCVICIYVFIYYYLGFLIDYKLINIY